MRIKDTIDYDIMKEYMLAPVEWFRQMGEVQNTVDGIYIYRNMNSKILGVAHLDSVNAHTHFHINDFAGEDYVFNTHLDDRLGAYILLHVLPLMGIHTDILLTVGEETHHSTAKYFTSEKQYNWMYSFDRKGTDAVHYRYTLAAWQTAMRKQWSIFHGSVSDIDYLAHLHCCGVNVGTGYHDEHDLMAYAIMPETISQIGKFMQFYYINRNLWYEHVPPPSYTAPVPTHTQTYTAPKNYTSCRIVEAEEEDFNPYKNMIIDMPLDIESYVTREGIIEMPEKCAFCLVPLTKDNVHVFMGICIECEPYALQCTKCFEFYCRTDAPSDDMGEELFYGLCDVCFDTDDRRFTSKDENTRFQDPNAGRGGEPNEDDQGDEDDFEGWNTRT